MHAVEVSADGIDFAVMEKHALGMRLGPAGECIGGKAGMHHCNLRDEIFALKIIIEGAQLRDQHHSLVYNGSARKGADISVGLLLFKDAAQNIEPAVEFNAMFNPIGTGDKALADAGHGSARARAQQLRMTGNIAPCDHG